MSAHLNSHVSHFFTQFKCLISYFHCLLGSTIHECRNSLLNPSLLQFLLHRNPYCPRVPMHQNSKAYLLRTIHQSPCPPPTSSSLLLNSCIRMVDCSALSPIMSSVEPQLLSPSHSHTPASPPQILLPQPCTLTILF